MNILFLTPRDSGKNLGGVERHVRLLTEELVRRGYRVKELALEDSEKINKINRLIDKWISRQIDEKIVYKFRAWKFLWERRELFGWADVVHIHDVFWWVLPFVPLIWADKYYKSYKDYKANNSIKDSPSHSRRRILFTTFHGWEGRWPPTKSAVIQKKLAAWLSDGTIGVGNFYQKWYGIKPDKVVWGAIKISNIKYQISNITKGDKKVVFFGRLEEVNGVEVTIEAVKLIRGQYGVIRSNLGVRQGWTFPPLDLSFVFVGDGSWREQAEKIGGVTGMVREPWKFLADADVVIASSYLAILEAAAMGKRIVAIANNPLKRDYLESHPLRDCIKIVGGVEELIDAITRLPRPAFGGARNDVGAARRWVMKQTPKRLADEYERLWNQKLA